LKYRAWTVRGTDSPSLQEVSAHSIDSAMARFEAGGHTVLGRVEERPSHTSLFSPKRASFSIILLTQDLLALLRCGFTIIEALRSLSSRANGQSALVLENVLQSLHAGLGFADAIAQTDAFPEFYIAVVRASEHSSDLPAALERYLEYATRMDEVRQKLISASVYPALLICAGGAAMTFLLLYVVPRFSGIYDGMHGELPWTATVMMRWGHLVRGHAVETMIVIVGIIGLVIGAMTHPSFKKALVSLVLKQRQVSAWINQFHLARLFRTLGTLLDGGIPLAQALSMAMVVLPVRLRDNGHAALHLIKEGRRPSAAFREANLFTPITDQMLAVGERGGNLALMMIRSAEFYEADNARVLERIMRVTEPVLMALIGLGIGVIIVLMYLPIFELAGAIQ